MRADAARVGVAEQLETYRRTSPRAPHDRPNGDLDVPIIRHFLTNPRNILLSSELRVVYGRVGNSLPDLQHVHGAGYDRDWSYRYHSTNAALIYAN
jgi:hypothetical protein